jgi:hypothetical protein
MKRSSNSSVAAEKRLTTAQSLLSVDNKAASKIKVPVKMRDIQYAEPLEYEILSDKKIFFTKARAFEFLELETFDGERPVREGHVQFLFDEWSSGRFLWHNVGLASAVLDKKVYRINGQHTSWMRVNIPDSKEPVEDAYVREIEYKVKDSDQLRALYSAFDRNAPRTVGHITKVMLMDTDAGFGIAGSYFRVLSAGFRMFMSNDWRNTSNTNELIAVIQAKYSTLFNTVGQFMVQHYGDAVFVRRSAVVGAMFATFEKAVKASIEFWEPVCNGIGMTEKEDPRYQLRKFLETHTHGTLRGKSYVSAESLHRMCITAWNHYRMGNKITRLIIANTDSDRPKARA